MTVTAHGGLPPPSIDTIQTVFVDSGSEIHVCPPEFWPSIQVTPAKQDSIPDEVMPVETETKPALESDEKEPSSEPKAWTLKTLTSRGVQYADKHA
eukprot:1694577-Amphidinium_carterae.2